MTREAEDFDRQMAIARDQMDKHDVVLSLLAQGEHSPHWSEDLAAEIQTAKVRLEKYRNSTQGR